MKLTTNYSNLVKALDTFKVILNDTLLADDKRFIILWNSEQGLKVVARNDVIDCICDIGVSEITADPNEMQTIKYKELIDVLDGFKSLSVTEPTDVTFYFADNVITVEVCEEPIDKDKEFADRLYRSNTYQLSKSKPVSDVQRTEITSVSLSKRGTEISKEDIMPYFTSLLPTVKDMREGVATRFNVVGDYVYTTPSSYVALMYNTEQEFRGFILPSVAATFMRSFFDIEDKTEVMVDELREGIKVVCIGNRIARAVVKTIPVQKAFKVDNYIKLPETGVAVDKGYFCDCLKRFKNNAEAIKIIITQSDIILKQSRVQLSVPIYNSRLPDDFVEMSFAVNSNILSNLVFAQANFSDLLFIYFQKVCNKWDVSFTDDTMIGGNHVWWTRANFKNNG